MQEAVQQAEDLELKGLMGNEFFTDLSINKTDAKYVTLLNGGNYTVNAKIRSFKGLNAVISNYAYAFYVLTANYIDTNSGVVVKRSENSDHAEYSKLKAHAAKYQSAAITYWGEVKDFLCNNEATYPLYCGEKKQPASSFGFTSIGRD